MATAATDTIPLQTGIIYGPVRSRRLGASLGINLLPSDYKLCSFNCLYCQYGWTSKPSLALDGHARNLPRTGDVAAALEDYLQRAARRKTKIDAITFSGNGEPTLHPELADIVAAARVLRDRYLPKVKLAILSNSSTIGRLEVQEALNALDLKLMKFDAGTEDMIRRLNAPAPPFYLGEVVAGLKTLKGVTRGEETLEGQPADPAMDRGPGALARRRAGGSVLAPCGLLSRLSISNRCVRRTRLFTNDIARSLTGRLTEGYLSQIKIFTGCPAI
ncbi:MAG: radical SAM protein [Deltaproteobacteria bacterium]|nr:radical SAM protein [Deltaproteobacteria bacterium]